MIFHLKMLGVPALTRQTDTIRLSQRKLLFLAFIACEPKGCTRTDLLNVFWPTASTDRGRHSLSQFLFEIRSIRGPCVLDATPQHIGLASTVTTDLAELERMLHKRLIFKACKLLRHGFLTDATTHFSSPFEDWLIGMRRQIAAQFSAAATPLAEQLITIQDWRPLLKLSSSLLQMDDKSNLGMYWYCCASAGMNVVNPSARAAEFRRRLSPTLRHRLDLLEQRTRRTLRTREVSAAKSALFVGRSAELAAVLDAVQSCGSCLITGNAGVGKTALLKQALSITLAGGVETLYVKCIESQRSLGFAPIIALIQSPTVVTALRRLPDGPRKLLTPWISFRSDEPDFRKDKYDRSVDWFILAESFVMLLQSVAQERQMILGLDDAQWADQSSIGLIYYLLRRLEESNIQFIIAERADWHGSGQFHPHSAYDGASYFAHVKLNSLDNDEAEAMIDSIFATKHVKASRAIRRLIVHKAQGLPLFIAELCRTVMNDAVGERFVVSKRGFDLQTSDSIRGYVKQRLAMLEHGAMRTVEMMAVHGGRLATGEWAALLQEREIDVRKSIKSLARVGIIKVDTDRMYGIEHDVFRECVYQLLSKSYRVMLHDQVAKYTIANRGAASVAAYHFEASDNRRSAFRFAIMAARHSERRFGYLDAADLYNLAASNSMTDDVQIRLRLRESKCCYQGRRYTRAREILDQLLLRAEQLPESIRVEIQIEHARVDARIADVSSTSRIDNFSQLTQSPLVRDNVERLAAIYSAWLTYAFEIGDHRGLPSYQDIYATLAPGHGTNERSTYYLEGAAALAVAGELDQGLQLLQASVAAVDCHGDPLIKTRAYLAIAALYMFVGDLAAAERYYRRYRAVAKQSGMSSSWLRYWNNLGVLSLEQGRFAEADRNFRRAITLIRKAGATSLEAMLADNYHLLLWESGRWNNVRPKLLHACRRELSVYQSTGVRSINGLIALHLGRLSEAVTISRSLMETLPDPGLSIADRAYAEMLISRVAVRTGKSDAAISRLRNMISIYEGRNRIDAMRMSLELARHLRRVDRDEAMHIVETVTNTATVGGALLLAMQGTELRDRIVYT